MLGVGPAFWRMKNYLDENQIPMKTAPAFIEMPPDDPPQTQNSQSSWLDKLKNLSKLLPKIREYTICFLLPMENQSNPPQPTNSKVKIVETGERYLYVRPYNDWVKADAAEAQVLFNSINITSYEKPHYAVGYNSPMNPNPYSEVWVVVDGVPQC
ncbi:uncharacterized protein soul5 [Boleophthalmus pectinirostris]|uniref:uncharacterized protein soul5 n=1 Tax=Boleophthalmus pectinirostris TaxID=150288 RepID=UPI00242AA94D|nr:uncharacterized protein soul5 [Boleophthalmus pectinirostris]